MTLSIIIVNYNVVHFLNECIKSIYRSQVDFDYEIIVVDNDSIDESRETIRQNFPAVIWIQNDKNLGFAKANNIGLAMAKGDYTLFLNPDTILNEDTLQKCLDFASVQTNFGAMGIKMYDGSGEYLQESKRSVPSAWDSITKITGLYKIAPRSAFWNGYYQGHLDPDQTHQVNALAGAFILGRTKALLEVGGFDERYFMYSEDIDLGYTLVQKGYEVYYFADAQIIHFKGESTKKSGAQFNRNFFESMGLFMEKYKNELYSPPVVMIFKGMIALVGMFTFLRHRLKPVFRFLMVFLGLLLVNEGLAWLWSFYKGGDGNYYPDWMYSLWVPGAVLIWAVFYTFFTSNKKQSLFESIWKSQLFGTGFLLIVYALLPESFRASRFLLLVGGLLNFVGLTTYFLGQKLISGKKVSQLFNSTRHVLLVSNQENLIKKYFENATKQANLQVLGLITDGELKDLNTNLKVGGMTDLFQVAERKKPDLILFDAESIQLPSVVSWMKEMGYKLDFGLIINENSYIESSSRNQQGQHITFKIQQKIDEPIYKMTKRAVDILLSGFMTIFLPYYILKGKAKSSLTNIGRLISGKSSMVGWRDSVSNLAPKSGLITLEEDNTKIGFPHLSVYSYVEQYNPMMDIAIFLKNWQRV